MDFTSKSHQTNLASSSDRIISMEAKGSSGCDISWLRKALDTIPFNFHISKVRKWELNENSLQIYTFKVPICSSPSHTALSCNPCFCQHDGQFIYKTVSTQLLEGTSCRTTGSWFKMTSPNGRYSPTSPWWKFSEVICGIHHHNRQFETL